MSVQRSLQTQKRDRNRYSILKELHFFGPMQRMEFSSRLGIRKTSISNIVAELLQAGLIEELEPGNIRSPIAISDGSYSVLAGHMQSKEFSVSEVRLDGRTRKLVSKSIRPDSGPQKIIPIIVKSFREAREKCKTALLGAGLAMPGMIDPDRGVCLSAYSYDDWQDIEIRKELEEQLGTMFLVDNDVRCLMWAGAWFGQLLRDYRNILLASIQEGVGGALMVDGKIITGNNFSAGEIGHIRAGREGRLCKCGREDCLETYCRLDAIMTEINKACGTDFASLDEVADETANNQKLITVLEGLADKFAEVLIPATVMFDPEVVLICTPEQKFTTYFRKLLSKRMSGELPEDDRLPRLITAGPSLNSIPQGIGARIIDTVFKSEACLQPIRIR